MLILWPFSPTLLTQVTLAYIHWLEEPRIYLLFYLILFHPDSEVSTEVYQSFYEGA